MSPDQTPASRHGAVAAVMRVGQQVRFDEGDGEHTDSLGVVSRVWPNGRYVSLLSDGRMFTRLIERVTPCVRQPRERLSIDLCPHRGCLLRACHDGMHSIDAPTDEWPL